MLPKAETIIFMARSCTSYCSLDCSSINHVLTNISGGGSFAIIIYIPLTGLQ